MIGRAVARGFVGGVLACVALPATAPGQTARALTSGSTSIDEPATASIATDLLTQTAAVLTVATGPGDVSSISVGNAAATGGGREAGGAVPTSAALLDANGGIAPAGLSVSIGGAGLGPFGVGGTDGGPLLILVQYN